MTAASEKRGDSTGQRAGDLGQGLQLLSRGVQ